MPLDLGKLGKTSLLDKELNPREIFNLLTEKEARYKYPRDVQTEVWSRWFERRAEHDVVLKMNTGGGKTVVGLLLLKSCLNEGVGPAVYVAPDKYLVKQVLKEAEALGISVVADPRAPDFLQRKAILVTNIYQLINGKSVFGVGDEGVKIPIGSVVVDDAHACLATAENQFTLAVRSSEPLYQELLTVFRDALMQQSDTKLLEMEAGEPNKYMLVPFWTWQQKSSVVARILTQHRNDAAVEFCWPLIKPYLDHCRCVFSGTGVEITPKCLPVEAIPAFVSAKRRIFMTATLADDSILVSDFNAEPKSITRHITPSIANDIGERMILIPQEIDPDVTDGDIKLFLKEKSKTYNTVVIVPSSFRAQFWADAADLVATTDNIEATVEKLKAGHVGLVVFVNKYDGIDLPSGACRILVLDGVPQARRSYEHIEANMLWDSEHAIGRQIQRIEQGMGRGIRGNDDYCVVLLMGGSLIKSLFLMNATKMFSPATLAQLELSKQAASGLGAGLQELDGAMKYSLEQDKEWRRLAREAIANVTYPDQGNVRDVAIAQRAAFDSAVIGAFQDAEQFMQRMINGLPNPDATTVGWLKWQLAEYVQHREPVRAQQILKSAIQSNRRLTRPIDGIQYEKLDATALHQANNVAWKLKQYVGARNKLIVQVNALVDELEFAEDNADQFESAMHQIAVFLGFGSQRPEVEFHKGPDVLWAVGNLNYFVIECKSGAVNELISKSYANQLSGSVNWFGERYDHTCTCTPIMVHPSKTFEAAATPHPKTRIITKELLPTFGRTIRDFVKAVSENLETIDAARIQTLLNHYRLSPAMLIDGFTVAPKGK